MYRRPVRRISRRSRPRTSCPLALTEAKHAARVKIDEDGCEAAAYTILSVCETAAMPPEEIVEFKLDEPFLFAITGADGLPLFVGIVNQVG